MLEQVGRKLLWHELVWLSCDHLIVAFIVLHQKSVKLLLDADTTSVADF
jgi:hypothetical protein